MSPGLATRAASAAVRSSLAVRRSRRRLLIVAVVAVMLLLAVAGVVWLSPRDDDLAADAVVTTSSTAPGFSAPDVVSGSAASPGAGWQSDSETSGAWVELAWPRPHDVHDVHDVVIVRNPLDEPGVTDGFLSFGDGSYLQVRLSATDRATTVPFSPRSVDRIRFTASVVSRGTQSVTVAEILVNSDTGDDDVVTGDAPDGNAASTAEVTESADAGASDAHALQDGSGAPGAAGAGADWTVDRPQGSWVQLDWDRPRELSAVELVGSPRSAGALAAATLTFADGTALPLGAVQADPGRPTILGFMPRVTTSVRFSIDRVSGSGPLALGELRVYERGATPVRAPPSGGVAAALAASTPCAGPAAAAAAGLVVDCPQAGAVVDADVDVRVATGAGYTAVTASVWPADEAAAAREPVRAVPDATGTAVLRLDVGGLPSGPVTVAFAATGDGLPTKTVLFPLYHRGAPEADPPPSAQAAGRTLAYAEEFDTPVALSRTGAGADYATGKPTASGVEDFGDAIFADAAQGTLGVVDDRYLRIDVKPSAADPQGWGRTHLGGLLASARPGGSGFSAQYGYFEARMLAPAAPGTWPAFWMLPSDGLVAAAPTGAEIDAVELYGQDPKSACHSTHQYANGKNVDGVARCGQRFPTERAAMAWHTYGVSITPTEDVFFVDGRVAATAPQVAGGGSPMFFLVDLALGGGWPVDLQGLRDRTALYVDYVRVYV